MKRSSWHEHAPFYLGAALLFVWALVGARVGELLGFDGAVLPSAILAVAVVLTCIPTILRHRNLVVGNFHTSLRDAGAFVADLDATRREHGKSRIAMEASVRSLEAINNDLSERVRQFEEVALNQRRIEQELMNNRQQAGEARRQVEKWENAALEYLSSLERMLSHPGLDQASRKLLEKAVTDFANLAASLGLHLIRPEHDSLLNEQDAVIEGEEARQDIEPERVVRCTSWGYRTSSGATTKAKVIIASRPLTAANPGRSAHRPETKTTSAPKITDKEGKMVVQASPQQPTASEDSAKPARDDSDNRRRG